MNQTKNYLQEKTLRDFYQKYNNPTLKIVSKLTGIQMTRVFRLSNGSKMKLEEYEIFKRLIVEERAEESELTNLIMKFEKIAKQSSIDQVSNLLTRNIKIWELKNNNPVIA